jgi:hypothetical protein
MAQTATSGKASQGKSTGGGQSAKAGVGKSGGGGGYSGGASQKVGGYGSIGVAGSSQKPGGLNPMLGVQGATANLSNRQQGASPQFGTSAPNPPQGATPTSFDLGLAPALTDILSQVMNQKFPSASDTRMGQGVLGATTAPMPTPTVPKTLDSMPRIYGNHLMEENNYGLPSTNSLRALLRDMVSPESAYGDTLNPEQTMSQKTNKTLIDKLREKYGYKPHGIGYGTFTPQVDVDTDPTKWGQ